MICAGFGGQGVLTMGLIIANSFVWSGKDATWIASYGAEMRGGTANCHIKISDKEIFSPYVEEADIIIALNGPSVNKFEGNVKSGGYLFVNNSIVPSTYHYRKDINVVLIPMTEIANEIENPKGANLVMLGAVMEKKGMFGKDEFCRNIDKFFAQKGKTNTKNAVCFNSGWEYAENHK